MDKTQANTFAQLVIGSPSVGRWKALEVLGHGKSAVVFKATDGNCEAALKIFHPETVERFGIETQMIRVERECALIGTAHPNLVDILDGGIDEEKNWPYVVMSKIDGTTLSKCLASIDAADIPKIIAQLASATKHLEDLGFVHRDIKPENIILRDGSPPHIVLLDCGVLKPIGDASATDQAGYRPFIGTHQYSPPEMLRRREVDSVEGWRSISFYQIGAVLHDLVNNKPLFDHHKDVFANLASAIDNENPIWESGRASNKLIGLGKRCLLKNTAERLRLVSWEDLLNVGQPPTQNLASRKLELYKTQQAQSVEAHITPLSINEEARVERERVRMTRESLREVVEIALRAFANNLPPRKIELLDSMHPSSSVRCLFPADPAILFPDPFHFEFSVALQSTSIIIEVYARAGKGDVSNEFGWVHLGGFLEGLTDAESAISDWIIDVIEEIIGV